MTAQEGQSFTQTHLNKPEDADALQLVMAKANTGWASHSHSLRQKESEKHNVGLILGPFSVRQY